MHYSTFMPGGGGTLHRPSLAASPVPSSASTFVATSVGMGAGATMCVPAPAAVTTTFSTAPQTSANCHLLVS